MLVKGEGMFKTFFKKLKSAGSGDGLDCIFMTGVSPIVLNDVTSGANVFEDISWFPEVNELCGFNKEELHSLVAQLVEHCALPETYTEEMMTLMHNNYNGSRFIDDYYSSTAVPRVYNPTLSFHFLNGTKQSLDGEAMKARSEADLRRSGMHLIRRRNS